MAQGLRLYELAPELYGALHKGWLAFDCPLGHPHRISIPLGREWTAEGTFPSTLTVMPLIHAVTAAPNNHTLVGLAYEEAARCGWQGFVNNGQIITV